MNEYELNIWKHNFNIIYNSEIILSRLKKENKITKKQYKEIKLKIKKKRYISLLSSPNLEGKEELRRKAVIQCLNDYNQFMGITKGLTFF